MEVRTGTDPGMLDSAMNPIAAIMARRPLLSSLLRFLFKVSSLTLEKSIGGKTISGSFPPFM